MANDLAPDVASLLELVASGPPLHFRDMSPEDARIAVSQMGQTLDLPPDQSVRTADHVISGQDAQVPVRSYEPLRILPNSPDIVFIHGGGWITGDLDSYDSFCRYLSSTAESRIISVDYRRAPEHTFPAAYEDALLVSRTILSGSLGMDCKDGIVLAGDSAGGGIAAAVAKTLADAGENVRAQLLFYPVLDVARRAASYQENAVGYLLEAADMEHFIQAYIPDANARTDPRCSPLLSEHMTGLPPLVIVTCGHDVLRDEGRAYAAACTRDGVETVHIEAPQHIHGAAVASADPYLESAISALKNLQSMESSRTARKGRI